MVETKIEREAMIYTPKKILDYTSKKGTLTIRDLEKVFGYETRFTRPIIKDLSRMGLVKECGWKVVEEDGQQALCRSYCLTKVGEVVKNYELAQKVLVSQYLKGMSVFDGIETFVEELKRRAVEFKQIKNRRVEKFI